MSEAAMKFRREPVSEATEAAKHIQDGDGVVLEENGKAVAAVISMSDLEDLLDSRDPRAVKRIGESRKDFETGNTRPASALLDELRTRED